MYLLLSGEGVSDMGRCQVCEKCEPPSFQAGAMAIMVDQLVEIAQGYEFSHLDNLRVIYVSESYLAEHNHKPKSARKMALPSKDIPQETRYYFQNARALAIIAKELSQQINDIVIAVLFRDADGAASASRENWQNKYNTTKNGFAVESFDFGVPMIPKKKKKI